MTRYAFVLLLMTTLTTSLAVAQEKVDATPRRRITLTEAIELARLHNHNVRIADYTVQEKERAKEVVKSAYFPSIRNDTNYLHVTDTQLIEIGAGSLGVLGGTPIPSANVIINQGSLDPTTAAPRLRGH